MIRLLKTRMGQASKDNYDITYISSKNSVLIEKIGFSNTKPWPFVPYEDASIYRHEINSIEQLGEIYIFENPDEIKHFLMANKDLIPILVKGHERITKIFGNVPLYLELHSDPEEGWEELFIVIKTSYPAEKAFELENKLFKEWFIEVMDKVNGRLNFTEEPL